MPPIFANPEWLWCLLLLPPLAGLRLWSHLRAKRGVPGLVSPRLSEELISGARQWTRWIVFGLQMLALGLLLIALARPQWGFEPQDTAFEGRHVIIAIDTSRSMLANDLQPDRLTRAKLAAQDIVTALPGDRIGLIAFAGKAFIQAPLTDDHDAVLETIRQFDTEIIPRGGTNLSAAAALALEMFEKAKSEESALIVFSDGEALEGESEDADLAERAKKTGTLCLTVGVGTVSGSIIPEPGDDGKIQPGVFVKDDEGNVVRSRMNPGSLQTLVESLDGGTFIDLAKTRNAGEVIARALKQLEAVRGDGEKRRKPIERFVWPLSFGLFFGVLAYLLPGTLTLISRVMRSRPVAGVPRPSAGTPPPLPTPEAGRRAAMLGLFLLAGAMVLESASAQDQAPVSGAAEAVKAGAEIEAPEKGLGFLRLMRRDFSGAVDAYRREIEAAPEAGDLAWLEQGLGVAAYRQGDFETAKDAFGRMLESEDRQTAEKGHYNLGNALFRQGESMLGMKPGDPDQPQLDDSPQKEAVMEQWKSAIEHYQAALRMNKRNESARHNLGVAQTRLALLEKKREEEKQKEDDQKDEEQEQQKDQQQQQENQQQPDQGQQPRQPEPGKPESEPGQPDPNEAPPPDQGPGQKPPPADPPKPDNQPPPDQPPQDGKLEGNPESPKPDREPSPSQPNEAKVNPETGFSPEEARQKLRNLSDEDADVRPAIYAPFQAEKFKNW